MKRTRLFGTDDPTNEMRLSEISDAYMQDQRDARELLFKGQRQQGQTEQTVQQGGPVGPASTHG